MATKEQKAMYPLAVRAINVQDACNLVAVVKSFESTLGELRKMYPEMGTDELKSHPVSVLFASKIASLTNCDGPAKFSMAWNAVKDIQEAMTEWAATLPGYEADILNNNQRAFNDAYDRFKSIRASKITAPPVAPPVPSKADIEKSIAAKEVAKETVRQASMDAAFSSQTDIGLDLMTDDQMMAVLQARSSRCLSRSCILREEDRQRRSGVAKESIRARVEMGYHTKTEPSFDFSQSNLWLLKKKAFLSFCHSCSL